jgi:hypothetical protein
VQLWIQRIHLRLLRQAARRQAKTVTAQPLWPVTSDADNISGSNSYHVVMGDSLTSSTVLDGFVITAGQATGSSPNDSGGGLYNDSGSPTLANLAVSGNVAQFGGGLYVFNGNPSVTRVVFRHNKATTSGVGACLTLSDASLTDATFSGNWAGSSAGALLALAGNAAVTNAVFSGNTAATAAGAVDNISGRLTVMNVTFSNNQTGGVGGAIKRSGGTITLTNATLWSNTAGSSGSQIYNASGTNLTVAYSDIEGSGGSASWDTSLGTDNGGNIDSDLLFVDADGADDTAGTLDDDLTLGRGPPAINDGDNDRVTVSTDLDGEARLVDIASVTDTGNGTAPIVDMGAYETQYVEFVLYLPVTLNNP